MSEREVQGESGSYRRPLQQRPIALWHALCAAIGLCLYLVAGASAAFGQAGPTPQANAENIPTIDRGRLDRQEPPLRRTQPVVPVPQPAASVAAPGPSSASVLRRVRFEGSTLDPQALAAAARTFAGAPLTRETLQKLANAITAVYAKSDIAFYAVSIPAQTMAGGIVTLRVVEGRIAGYTLAKQTRSTPTTLIRAQLQPLLAEKPTHRSSLERSLSLLRDTPGQTVKADLRLTDRPDELALALDVERKQVEFTLNVNNRGVVNVTTGVQAQLGVALNGLLREGDSTRLTTSIPFQPSRYQFYSGGHTTPIGASGTTLGFSGAYVRTRTREPEVLGDAKQFGISVSHPVIRSYKRNLTMMASFDGTNSENYFLDAAFGGFRTRTARLGANWSVLGPKDGYAVSISLSQGLDALGARPTLGYSEASYRKANLQAVGVKQLAKKVSAKLGVRGQCSQDLLPTAERFALGGEGAGLAYRYGVVTVDQAIAADAEVSWQVLGSATAGRGLSLFSFADAAKGRSHARPAFGLGGQSFKIASAGAGVRFTPIKSWSASAQLAVPLRAPGEGFSEKPRFFFSISRTV